MQEYFKGTEEHCFTVPPDNSSWTYMRNEYLYNVNV